MPTQALQLNVPDGLYQHLKDRAELARRSVEEETLDVLATAIPADTLSGDHAEVLESLESLDEPSLWKAASNPLAEDVSSELEFLHFKQQREGLNEAEAQRVAHLVRQYERHLLIRAKAAALLKSRGHDVSDLLHK